MSDDVVCTCIDAMNVQHGSDFVLELRKAQAFAGEPDDEIAQRPHGGAKTQLAEQLV